MINKYLMNPVDLAFHKWATNNNNHPCDEKRFYEFINTVFLYINTDGKNWVKKDFFIKRCKDSYIDEEEANLWFKEMKIIIDYRRSNAGSYCKINRNIPDGCKKITYIQTVFFDGKYMELAISKDDFNSRKIGKKEFLIRVNKNQ